MTSIIKLQVLSGAMDESSPCYILQVDEVRILLDCGWDEKFDPNFIKELKRHVNSIDAVLLSYPDVSHLGALPYLVGKLGLNCPIYATIPVYKMGQMFMYDLFLSHYNMYDFNLFSLDDIDVAFEKIVQLKYNQTVSMKGKGYGITITPIPAGHMIGGTIWKIVKIGEEDIIYAVDFNHKKERHLNGCELEKLQRPSLLITDSQNVKYQQARRRARDEKLMTNILQTMRNSGNVLVVVDTAGRILEIAHMLDQLWKNKDSGLIAYSLAFLTNVSYNTVEFAKSQIEWMSDKLMKNFEGARNNPFQFKHINLCHNLLDLARVPNPKVVLSSMPDLESGFARELFVQWAGNSNNSIIFTSRPSPGTLARDLIENGGHGRKVEVDIRKRIELEGIELEEYMQTKGYKLNQTDKQDSLEDSSESEYDLEMNVITGKHDIVLKPDMKSTLGFFKSNRKNVAFPFVEEKFKSDEYGEIINLDEYKITDSSVEPVNEILGTFVNDSAEIGDNETGVESFNNYEKPTKCVNSRKLIQINAQIQYIDFEGRSDGESILKILSQLRPRRVIVVRGLKESVDTIFKHCTNNIGAKVFTPKKGEIVDATTEAFIYQIRLTENLVSRLQFHKGKDAEVAWLDAEIGSRKKFDEIPVENEDSDTQPDQNNAHKNILTLEPLETDEIPIHNAVFINELRLFDFKQVLLKNNISSEFSSGVLWCNNGNIAIKRLDAGRVAVEGCLCEEYYKIRELLYQQYAIV